MQKQVVAATAGALLGHGGRAPKRCRSRSECQAARGLAQHGAERRQHGVKFVLDESAVGEPLLGMEPC